MIKEIKRDEVEKYEVFRKKLYYKDGLIYKICYGTSYTKESLPLFLTYIDSLPPITGLAHPEFLLKDNTIYGYALPYYQNSKTILKYIFEEHSLEEKYDLIIKLCEALRSIHKYIIFGDINFGNILVIDNNPLFIDFENGKTNSDKDRVLSTLYVTRKNYNRTDNHLDDLIKLFIVCISILYEYNFESFITPLGYKGLYELKKRLIEENADQSVIFYLEYLIENNTNKDPKLIYFDEILSYIKNTTIKSTQARKRSLLKA